MSQGNGIKCAGKQTNAHRNALKILENRGKFRRDFFELPDLLKVFGKSRNVKRQS
jgi:hypothetical protein